MRSLAASAGTIRPCVPGGSTFQSALPVSFVGSHATATRPFPIGPIGHVLHRDLLARFLYRDAEYLTRREVGHLIDEVFQDRLLRYREDEREIDGRAGQQVRAARREVHKGAR